LKRRTKKLEAEVAALQRQADDHAGQLRVIMTLIESTINERAAQTAEQAAARVIERFLSLRDDQPPKIR
jgi:hypothetical protein